MALAGLTWGHAHSQGPRPSDEDAWCIVQHLGGRQGTLFVGVFDGHGGEQAARLAADLLPRLFAEALAPISPDNPEEIRRAFLRAYEDTSARLSQETRSGTTAATLWITPRSVWYAHVGDTRIVLVQGGEVKRLTRDHKVRDPQEFARLQSLGAQFWGPYIVLPSGEGLAVARALGDPAFAPFVIPTPDVGFFPRPAQEAWLIIACDGLWDVLSDEEAGRIATGHPTPQEAADALLAEALARDTADNVTVIVVHLRSPEGTEQRGQG